MYESCERHIIPNQADPELFLYLLVLTCSYVDLCALQVWTLGSLVPRALFHGFGKSAEVGSKYQRYTVPCMR